MDKSENPIDSFIKAEITERLKQRSDEANEEALYGEGFPAPTGHVHKWESIATVDNPKGAVCVLCGVYDENELPASIELPAHVEVLRGISGVQVFSYMVWPPSL